MIFLFTPQIIVIQAVSASEETLMHDGSCCTKHFAPSPMELHETKTNWQGEHPGRLWSTFLLHRNPWKFTICHFKCRFLLKSDCFDQSLIQSRHWEFFFLSKQYRGCLRFKKNVSLLCFEEPLAVECGNFEIYDRTQV